MAKLNREGINEGKANSSESSSEAATLSDTHTTCPTSSSLLRFSTDDRDEAEEGQEKKKTSRTFEEIASKVIREMQEIERERKGKSIETRRLGYPLQIPLGVDRKELRENPNREIYDLTEMDDEGAAGPDDWRSRMEETVNALVVENAEQNALLKSQREQMTRMVYLVDRVISCMEKESQSSHQPLPASSVASQNKPPQNVPDTDLAGTLSKKKGNHHHQPTTPCTS